MSVNLVRGRFSAIAAKIETTQGTDSIAGSPVLADFILGSGDFRMNPQVVEDPSFSGALDVIPGVVGSFMPEITINVPMRGTGAGGTAPSWGRLMRACTFEEVVDATGVAATAATAGTTSTATFPVAFSATAQVYRGVAGILTGNPAAGVTTAITNWTTGRVATYAETFGSTLSTSTLMQIPVNTLYRPTSDETVYQSVTLYLYNDGILTTFTGCVGSVRLELTAGGMGMLVFTMRGRFGAISATALPTALTAGTAQNPPIWQGGRSQLLGRLAQCRTLSIDAGVGLMLPENPEAPSGYNPAVPISRAVRTTIDPLMNTTNQVALFNNFIDGTSGSLMAQLGTAAGNRFMVSQPSIRMLQADPTDRQGLRANAIQAAANSTDASFFLCCY
jgi:hypothetical protein